MLNRFFDFLLVRSLEMFLSNERETHSTGTACCFSFVLEIVGHRRRRRRHVSLAVRRRRRTTRTRSRMTTTRDVIDCRTMSHLAVCVCTCVHLRFVFKHVEVECRRSLRFHSENNRTTTNKEQRGTMTIAIDLLGRP
jgi:hypothetical protein